jgi:hypothetical protein
VTINSRFLSFRRYRGSGTSAGRKALMTLTHRSVKGHSDKSCTKAEDGLEVLSKHPNTFLKILKHVAKCGISLQLVETNNKKNRKLNEKFASWLKLVKTGLKIQSANPTKLAEKFAVKAEKSDLMMDEIKEASGNINELKKIAKERSKKHENRIQKTKAKKTKKDLKHQESVLGAVDENSSIDKQRLKAKIEKSKAKASKAIEITKESKESHKNKKEAKKHAEKTGTKVEKDYGCKRDLKVLREKYRKLKAKYKNLKAKSKKNKAKKTMKKLGLGDKIKSGKSKQFKNTQKFRKHKKSAMKKQKKRTDSIVNKDDITKESATLKLKADEIVKLFFSLLKKLTKQVNKWKNTKEARNQGVKKGDSTKHQVVKSAKELREEKLQEMAEKKKNLKGKTKFKNTVIRRQKRKNSGEEEEDSSLDKI